MGKRNKRVYTLEFKQQAADLASRIGTGQAAIQLGVNVANVNRWKKQKNKIPIPKTEETPEQENLRLKKENEELKKVNYILKKAAAFFSQDHLK